MNVATTTTAAAAATTTMIVIISGAFHPSCFESAQNVAELHASFETC